MSLVDIAEVLLAVGLISIIVIILTLISAVYGHRMPALAVLSTDSSITYEDEHLVHTLHYNVDEGMYWSTLSRQL